MDGTTPNDWAGIGTATISDALDALGLRGSVQGLGAVVVGSSMIGRAHTVRYAPAVDSRGSVGDFLDDFPDGAVVAIDNGGRLDCTVWGGIMSEVAHHRGLAGAAIHGVCRDLEVASALAFPLFSRGSFMRTGKDRVQIAAVGEDISLGDARVAAGDLVVGDADGVVVVLRSRESEVLERALTIHAAEERIVERVRSGQRLADARAAEGYHLLQRDRA
jgi:regulator of RNase E activity RraA